MNSKAIRARSIIRSDHRQTKLRILKTVAALFLLSIGADAQLSSITGTAQYQDRPFDMGGFTFSEPYLPARFCRVEVLDANGIVCGAGETNEAGEFSFPFIDLSSSFTVRMMAWSLSRDIKIQDESQSGNPVWAVQVVGSATNPPNPWDVGTVQASIINDPTGGGRVGNPFNLLDEALKAMDFLSQQVFLGSPPTIGQTINIGWPRWPAGADDGGGSYYPAGTSDIHMGNGQCCADTIFHHEFGHLVQFFFGENDQPSAKHPICGTDQDPALSWGEGWATFWGSNAMKAAGVADPGIFVWTDGFPNDGSGPNGFGNLIASVRLEDQTNLYGENYCGFKDPWTGSWVDEYALGKRSELAVACALWDLTDVAGDNPNDPEDDDPFDGTLLPGGVMPWAAQWDVFSNYMIHPAIPNSQDLMFDHFWDGWFERGYMNTASLAKDFRSTAHAWGITRDIYVDVSAGSWGADGTPDHPYPTVVEGFTAAPAGAHLHLASGDYHESFFGSNKLIRMVHGGGSGSAVIDGE